MAFWLMVLALGLAAHALISNRALRRRAEGLERRLAALERGLGETRRPEADLSPPAGTEAPWDASARPSAKQQPSEKAVTWTSAHASAPTRSSETSSAPTRGDPRERAAPGTGAGLAAWLREHWFLAVAAVSLALAGVTLVQAVAERGLLGPGPRVGLAVALGLALLVAGEAIRRRANDEAGAATALPAAFSGAGVVVLFSAVLAARTLYDLIGPETALVLLVGVAAAAVALGWLHGPLLAAVGIGGAMAAPFLVGGEAGDPTLLYAHFGVVALAGLLIDAARRWRWVTALSLALALGAGLLLNALAGGPLALMALALALALMAIAVPGGRFVPRHRGLAMTDLALRPRLTRGPRREVWVAAGTLAAACAVIAGASNASAAAFWTATAMLTGLFAAVALWARRAPALADLAALPVAGLLAAAATQPPLGEAYAFYAAALADPERSSQPAPALLLAVGVAMALMAARRGLWERGRRGLAWAGGAASVLPLLVAAMEVAWRPTALIGATAWAMYPLAASALMTALTERFAALDARRGGDLRRASLFALSALGLLAFALIVVLSDAALTVALAAAVPAAAVLARRTGLRLDIALLAGAAVLLWRGVVEPGLPWAWHRAGLGEIALAYGASVAALAGALLVRRPPAASPVARASEMALALLAATGVSLLFARGVEAAGAPAAAHWSLGLLASVWLLAARAQLTAAASDQAARLARAVTAAVALAVGAALVLAAVVVANPAVWMEEAVVGPIALNSLIPAYLLPAALLVALDRPVARLLPRLAGMGRVVGAALATLYAALAIRHAWRGAEGMARRGVGDGELYTYTLALLLLGSALLHQAVLRGSVRLRLVANAVLVATIAKVFLIDAAGLEGLTRSASFLALGLCLAGLAWLNRRLAPGSA